MHVAFGSFTVSPYSRSCLRLSAFVYAGFGRNAAVLKSLLQMFCPMLAGVTRGFVTPGVNLGSGSSSGLGGGLRRFGGGMTLPPSKSLLQYVPNAVAGSPDAHVCASANVAVTIKAAVRRYFIISPCYV